MFTPHKKNFSPVKFEILYSPAAGLTRGVHKIAALVRCDQLETIMEFSRSVCTRERVDRDGPKAELLAAAAALRAVPPCETANEFRPRSTAYRRPAHVPVRLVT